MYQTFLETSYGYFKIVSSEDTLLFVTKVSYKEVDFVCPFLEKCRKELEEYFQGVRKTFDLPISFHGTVFQEKVWNALLNVPYGKTVSYLDIAKMIGHEKAVRAVGGAIHRNPLMIIIPCHRVIGSNGTLVGFAHGTMLKQALLDLEREHEMCFCDK